MRRLSLLRFLADYRPSRRRGLATSRHFHYDSEILFGRDAFITRRYSEPRASLRRKLLSGCAGISSLLIHGVPHGKGRSRREGLRVDLESNLRIAAGEMNRGKKERDAIQEIWI